MATTTFAPVASPAAEAPESEAKRPFLLRVYDNIVRARTLEARRQIQRMDPVYARLLDAPSNVRETWAKSGRWHEQG